MSEPSLSPFLLIYWFGKKTTKNYRRNEKQTFIQKGSVIVKARTEQH
jgi:hypothetical protein